MAHCVFMCHMRSMLRGGNVFEDFNPVEEANNGIVQNNTPKNKTKPRRDIFRFAGEKPAAINLEHVTQINVEGKRITFQFYSTAMFIDMDDEEAAKNAFEQILNVWSADVLE